MFVGSYRGRIDELAELFFHKRLRVRFGSEAGSINDFLTE